MIPSIFEARSRSLDCPEGERRHWARSHSGALIGFATAVGALGGVAINLTLRQAWAATGSETPAFWIFLATYCAAAALTWVMYVRRPPRMRPGTSPRAPRDTQTVPV
jgi:NNP family nitrate/nitrite transporter-like MFS transporter